MSIRDLYINHNQKPFLFLKDQFQKIKDKLIINRSIFSSY